jgi:hypothetical protein
LGKPRLGARAYDEQARSGTHRFHELSNRLEIGAGCHCTKTNERDPEGIREPAIRDNAPRAIKNVAPFVQTAPRAIRFFGFETSDKLFRR